MDDGLEIPAGRRILEDDAAERRAIEVAFRIQNGGAEAVDHGQVAGAALVDGLARQTIRIDDGNATRGEGTQTVRLAGGDATRQSHSQQSGGHCASAAGMISASVSVAGVIRSSTNEFHSWQWGHCQISSVLRYRHRRQTCGSR